MEPAKATTDGHAAIRVEWSRKDQWRTVTWIGVLGLAAATAMAETPAQSRARFDGHCTEWASWTRCAEAPEPRA